MKMFDCLLQIFWPILAISVGKMKNEKIQPTSIAFVIKTCLFPFLLIYII